MSGLETALIGAGVGSLWTGEISADSLLVIVSSAVAALLVWRIKEVFRVLALLCRVVIVPASFCLGLLWYMAVLAREGVGDVVRWFAGSYFRFWEALRRWVFLNQSWRRAWRNNGQREMK